MYKEQVHKPQGHKETSPLSPSTSSLPHLRLRCANTWASNHTIYSQLFVLLVINRKSGMDFWMKHLKNTVFMV